MDALAAYNTFFWVNHRQRIIVFLRNRSHGANRNGRATVVLRAFLSVDNQFHKIRHSFKYIGLQVTARGLAIVSLEHMNDLFDPVVMDGIGDGLAFFFSGKDTV